MKMTESRRGAAGSSPSGRWKQLRDVAAQSSALLLDQRKSFTGLVCLVLMGTVLESAGIGLVLPLIAALQGEERPLTSWLARVPFFEQQSPVVAAAAIVAAVFLLKGAVSLVRIRWSLTFTYRLWQRWVQHIVENILFAPVQTRSDQKSGALMATALVETRQVARMLLAVVELFVSVFTFLCLYIVLWLASWRVTLVLTAVLVVLVFSTFRPLTRAAHIAGARRLKSYRASNVFFLEIVGGLRDLKALCRERAYASTMLGHLRDTRRALVSAQWWAAFVRPVIETGFVLTFCAVVVFLWTQEDLAADLPLVGVFSAAAFRLMPVVSGVGRQWVLLISKQPSVRSVVRA